MEKFDLTGLPELKGHPELKEYMESAWKLIRAEEYRAAAGELRQSLEYMVDCYMEAAREEGEEASGAPSLHGRIEFLKNGDWITDRQASDFHEIRMRCNAGVHRNFGSQVKQATPADIRYCYELLIQGLPKFFEFFPGEELSEEQEESEEPEVSKEPEVPRKPEEPGKLEEPKAPEEAKVPRKPEMPEEPKAPRKPEEPGKLEEPKAPEEPEKLEELEAPKKPEVLEGAETAEKPEGSEALEEPECRAADSEAAESRNAGLAQQKKKSFSKVSDSILEDRSGEATEDVFADMMKELLRKMK